MNGNEKLSDDFLLDELRKRLAEKNHSLKLQQTMLFELEELNDRLQEADRVKSGFLSNIRNEVNNPLSSIIGLAAQLMTGRITEVDKIKRVAYLISKEAFSLDFQMRNIFAAAEIEAGEVNVKPSIVNIEELIHSQIKYFSLKSDQKKISVSSELVSGLNMFQTDPYILHSIVMNLLSNAIEYSREKSDVSITTDINNKKLVLTVQDYGEGFNVKDYPHIFDRFRQLEGGTTKKHQGHGLGLSIVKEFVDALRGQLNIQSEKGKGTTVTVELPSLSEDLVPEGFSDGDEIIFGNEEVL